MRRRQFLALFALGVVGVVSILPMAVQIIGGMQLPANAPPRSVLVLLAVLQPAILVAIAVAVGLRFAPRLGFRSYVVEAAGGGPPVWPALRRDLRLAITVGVIAMTVVVLLDAAFRPFMGDAWRLLEQMQNATNPALALVMGLLYGGMTEEILLRWGLLSLFAWLGWRFGGRAVDGNVRPLVVWVAIAVSAILFGLGHLPAVRTMVPLAPTIVVRTILLNALAAVAFGWLYWRRSLEAAMVAHATGHVVLFVVRLATR